MYEALQPPVTGNTVRFCRCPDVRYPDSIATWVDQLTHPLYYGVVAPLPLFRVSWSQFAKTDSNATREAFDLLYRRLHIDNIESLLLAYRFGWNDLSPLIDQRLTGQ